MRYYKMFTWTHLGHQPPATSPALITGQQYALASQTTHRASDEASTMWPVCLAWQCMHSKQRCGSATISLHNGTYMVGTNVIVTYRNRCSWAAYLYDPAMSTLTF